jgi:ribosome-associated protein
MPLDSNGLRELALDAIEELKGENIVVLDVKNLTFVTDHMIITSGRSARQVKALAENVIAKAKAAGERPLGIEGLDGGEWVLVDLVDVVVHVMQPDTRAYYELEKLWSATPTKSDAQLGAPEISAAPS